MSQTVYRHVHDTTSMIRPPYLQQGDKVAIISSAKRTTPEEIQYGIHLLQSWGLEPVPGKHVFSEHHFFAGTDEERAEDVQQMLDDDSIKAVFFSKGAYGTLRIIDQLDFSNFRKHPKWLVGYSDITVLHNHIHNFDIETIHAVMLQGMPGSTQASTDSLRQALFGEELSYTIPNVRENKSTEDTIEGTLVGGNLSMLYALVGSTSDIHTDGKILFIEDIDEYLYHVDRMMLSLRRSGKLSNLKALLVGGMVGIKESTLPFGTSENDIILEHTQPFSYPVYFGFPSGHIQDNRTLILGRTIRMSQNNDTVSITFCNK